LYHHSNGSQRQILEKGERSDFHQIYVYEHIAYHGSQIKKTTASHGSTTSHKPAAIAVVTHHSQSAPSEQKKKSGLKAKAYKRKPDAEGHVLGGADYVELMMGSRRKAREEAAKLPKDPEDA
jgi:hypothetical protein